MYIRVHTRIAVYVLPLREPNATALGQSPSGCSGAQSDSRLLKERDPLKSRTHPGVRTSTYRFSAAAFVSLGPLLKHTKQLSVTASCTAGVCCHTEAPWKDPSASLNKSAQVAILAHPSRGKKTAITGCFGNAEFILLVFISASSSVCTELWIASWSCFYEALTWTLVCAQCLWHFGAGRDFPTLPRIKLFPV